MPNPAALNAVLNQLSAIHPLSDELCKEFVDKSIEISVKKDEYLMRKGELSKYVYFVVKGIITGQVPNKDETLISFITIDGEFLSAIEGMYGDKSCKEDVRAVEDSSLLAMCSSHFYSLYDRFPELNIVFRKILEAYYADAHYRSIFIRIGKVSDKYNYFLQTYPKHADRIPVAIAASFLNIKSATLLKMIAKMKDEKAMSLQLSRETIIAKMDKFQPYLQKKLTLQQLADLMNTKGHQLSYLLNEYFNENFNCFINRFRIDYILKEFAGKGNLDQYSMDGLGRQAGFSSKSTFFSEFKKRVGETPQNYFKQTIAEDHFK
ncbi:helix-turn-helix domain-containing protein [Pedobacter nyackensis]|uniref:cAMP-binding domain of CRP or a regulatory subunit of cAMP-dependent protein kinases n=1 Tax=Pedobacter nyackensis TaxID=475255 RepID=A0A1W2E6Z8_9SPHI|nr:helix-turn-helix domain-containing protein [Pedobacter nyackensis]SMD05549.1 cAMP-binding domain of CRP or a regulatory subunit of cAMP-dependent protein kinases [Pedobacter nyackensis]